MREVWVGRTEVAKAEGCELDLSGVGAFVWWATQADSQDEFLRKLRGAIYSYKLVLLEVDHIREFSESDEVSDDFYEMVDQARKDESWVVYGTFHATRTMAHEGRGTTELF